MIDGLCSKDLDLAIGTDYLPYRKKICLVVREGCSETKLASFDSPATARLFMEKLKELIGFEEEKA